MTWAGAPREDTVRRRGRQRLCVGGSLVIPRRTSHSHGGQGVREQDDLSMWIFVHFLKIDELEEGDRGGF